MKPTNKAPRESNATALAETLLLCLYYVLACTYIPLCSFLGINETVVSAISLAVCVLGLFALSRAAGTFKAIVGYAIILGIFVFFGGGITLAGIFAAFSTAACIYAHLLLKRPSPFLWGLPAIPFVIALLTVSTATAAVVSLATLPASLTLVWAIKDKAGRVGAICRISTGICAIAILAFLCSVYSAYGEITLTACKDAIDASKIAVSDILTSTAHDMENALGTEATLINIDGTIDYAVGIVFNVLPAVLVICANLIAYILHSMMLSIECVTLEDKKEALPMMSFEMSIVSAIVFLISLVLSFVLTSEKTALYGAVAKNLMLILVPGLILTALAGLRAFAMRKGPSCLGTIVYMGAIFLIASLNAFVLIAASIAGAVLIILANIAKAKADKNNG